MFKKAAINMSITVCVVVIFIFLAFWLTIISKSKGIIENTAQRNKDLAEQIIATSDKSLQGLAEQYMKYLSKATAAEVYAYMVLNPKLLNHMNEFMKDRALESPMPAKDPALKAKMDVFLLDKGLRKLTIQPVGTTGYTSMLANDGVTYIHFNEKIQGVNMNTLKDKLPEFWNVYYNKGVLLQGENTGGYYDWEDKDKIKKAKYIYFAQIGNTKYRIGATTYMHEFTSPMKDVREASFMKIAQLKKKAVQEYEAMVSFTPYLILLIALVIGVGVVFWQVNEMKKSMQEVIEISNKISNGDYNVRISDSLKEQQGEVGELSNSLDKIVTSLKFLSSEARK